MTETFDSDYDGRPAGSGMIHETARRRIHVMSTCGGSSDLDR